MNKFNCRNGFRSHYKIIIRSGNGEEREIDTKKINIKVVLRRIREDNDKIKAEMKSLGSDSKNSKIKEIQKKLKSVVEIGTIIPEYVTFTYQDIYLSVPVDTYKDLLMDEKLLVYWYGKFFVLPNTKMFLNNLYGSPKDVFVVDNDWLNEVDINLNGETVETELL